MAPIGTASHPMPVVSGSTAPSDEPSPPAAVIRWATRWPEATAAVIAVVIWFAIDAVLAEVLPAAPAPIGYVGFAAGAIIGTGVVGLEGPRRWVVVPVITLALGLILGGALLAIS